MWSGNDIKSQAIVTVVAVVFTTWCQVGGADDDDHHDSIHIPEPMVFDLVRGLGAEKGEFEANVLALFPLTDTSDHPIEWAPEVEGAVANGIALEFEVPFEDSDLEAYKVAAQFTVGTVGDNYIHGLQFIAEDFEDYDHLELTALYLGGYRFNDDWSALGMAGFRSHSGDDAFEDDELILNFSLFKDINHRVTVGIENDYATDLGSDWKLLVMPQVHYELSEHYELQAGVGVEFISDDEFLAAGFRLIYSN